MKEIVRQYYTLVVLLYCGANATAAMYTTFLLAKGMSLTDVLMIKLTYFAVLTVCLFPLGALADLFGRKKLVLTSCTLFIPSMMIYAYSNSFWFFVLAEAFGAIAQACANCACNAWFVGRVRHFNNNNGDDKLGARFSLAWVLRPFAMMGAGFGGGLLSGKDMTYPWMLGSCFFVLAFSYACLKMREEYFVPRNLRPRDLWTDLKQRTRSSFQYGIKNHNIRFVMTVVFAVYFAWMVPNLYWQPWFAQWAADSTSQGLILVGMSASLMLGALLAPYMTAYVRDRSALLICLSIIALGIIGMVALDFPMALLAFFVCLCARGTFTAIIDAFLHNSIKGEEQRAAVASLESVAYHTGGALSLITWRIFLKGVFPMPTALLASGCVLLVATLFLSAIILWKKRGGK